MAEINWTGLVIIAAIVLLLANLKTGPAIIGPQALLNIEQDKTATIIIGLTSPEPDVDNTDGNYTQNIGAYRIITTNGTIIRDWAEKPITTSYQESIEYAPTYNSTIQAKTVEKLYAYNLTTNTSALVSERVTNSQDININVVAKQEATIVVTQTSSGSGSVPRQIVPSGSVQITTTETPAPEEGFWEKYGLLTLLVVSFVIFGLATYSYLTGKGRRRRR